MSTEPFGAALTRDDPAVTAADAPETASEQSSELAAIATAIERIEALLTASGPDPEGSESEDTEAIERIADIAFVLHERDVEASLCDALDAAVRELANANAAKQTNVHHVRQAAEMLRELSQRVADMVALLQVSAPPAANHGARSEATPNETVPEEGEPATADQSAGEDALDSEIPREGLFPAELLEDDEFARAVAELAASLPALAEPVEAVVVTLRGPADLAAEEPVQPPHAPEPDGAVVVALYEPAATFVAEAQTSSPEPDDAVTEAQSEAGVLAADEPGGAFELVDAVAEAEPEAADLTVGKTVRAAEPEETVSGPQHDVAELPAGEPALEQQPPAMDETPTIQQTLAKEFPVTEVTNGEPSREDEAPARDAAPHGSRDAAITEAMPESEDVLSEALSEETLLGGADAPAQQRAGFAGASPDHALMNGHAVASPAAADAPRMASDAISSPAPEPMPESETAPAPDIPLTASHIAEPEGPPPSEAPVPADADAHAILAGQPFDQNMLRHHGDDEPAQIADESPSHDADEVLAESATEVKEELPPRSAESSQTLLPELALVDPQDDPGDLFEPLAGATPSIPAAKLAESRSAREISAHAAEKQARCAAAATDPLAAMRTLNAEELLALFT